MKFKHVGLLAMNPRALGIEYENAPLENKVSAQDATRVAVLSIRGPLTHHPEMAAAPGGFVVCFDSYDAIKMRAAEAFASSAQVVLLRVDSPGGHLSGCLDLAYELRARAEAAGKTLIAYVENATSAAYALACSASKIFASATACVGSIGVYETLVDQTAADHEKGFKFELVTSGRHKATSNPHTGITPEAREVTRAFVDATASEFWGLVASSRGLGVEQIAQFEAVTMTGRAALAARLVDEIATLDQALAFAGSADAAAPQKENEMSLSVKEMLAALRVAAEGDDEDGKFARKMLAVMSEEEKKPEDKPEAKAEDKPEDKPEAKAEDKPEDKPEAKAEDKPEDKPEAKASTAAALTEKNVIDIVERRALASEEKAQVAVLLAARPDIAADVREDISKMPLAMAQKWIERIPRSTSPARAAIAGATHQAADLRGKLDTDGPTNLSGHGAMLDQAMGFTQASGGVRNEGRKLVLSAVPAKKDPQS